MARADTAASPPRNLLGSADYDHFWVARVVPSGSPGSDETNLLFRNRWGGTWTPMQTVSSRVVSVASQSGELLVVLQDGQWMIANADDLRVGLPPPDRGNVVAIANEHEQNVVWAVVSDEGPTTQPATQTAATQPASLPTQPSIGPMPVRWLVYRLVAGQWKDPHLLPQEAGDEPVSLSMTVVDEQPAIAWRGSDGSILVSRLSEHGDWSPDIHIKESAPNQEFSLLSSQGHLALWTAGANPGETASAGDLHVGDDLSQILPLQIHGNAPANPEQTLALAFGHWWWLAADGDQIFEQSYDLQGQPQATVTPMGNDKPRPIPLQPFVTGAMLIVTIAVVAAASQRRSHPNIAIPADEVAARLAPPGLRVAAGLIDLVPFIAAIGALPRGVSQTMVDRASVQNILIIAISAYILHTMLAELICGRSIGKMMFGLRVLDHEGKVPSAASVIARNLLRIVDICVIVSLVIMFVSPLRQRVGDLAGGTVVVLDDGQAAPPDNE